MVDLSNKQHAATLEVKYGEETYAIPLGGSLTHKQLKRLRNDDEEIIAFLGQYMPKKVVEELTLDSLIAIMKAWREETQKVSGLSLGEL